MTDLEVPSISVAQAMAGGFQVVDVRSPGEFAEGHMPGAVNHPFLDDRQRAAGRAHRGGVRPRGIGIQTGRFRRGLRSIGARLPRRTLLSLETAFDDGRFTDVVKGLLVEYYDPLYERSCVEGRGFVLEFATSPDPVEDAHRFAREATRLIREVSLQPSARHR